MSDNDNVKIYISKDRGIVGDMYQAIRTIKDDPTGDKKRMLASGAGTLGLLAGAAYLVKNRPPASTVQYSQAQRAAYGAAQLGALGTISGGSYYAYKNRDNAKKRNIGLGIAGVGSAALGTALLTSPSPTSDKLFAGAAYGLTGALPISLSHTSHLGQKIHEQSIRSRLVEQGFTDEEINKAVRDSGALNSDHPELRYIDRSGLVDSAYETFKTAGAVDKVTGAAKSFRDVFMGSSLEKRRVFRDLRENKATVDRLYRMHKLKGSQDHLDDLRTLSGRARSSYSTINNNVNMVRSGTALGALATGTAAYQYAKRKGDNDDY